MSPVVPCHRKPSRTPPQPPPLSRLGSDMLSATPSLTLQVNGFLGLSHGVCTANPANLHHLLRSNIPNYVKGSRFHSVLRDLLGHGIFNVDGHVWAAQRKLASHEFNTKSLKHFISSTIQSHLSGRLILLLSSACRTQEIVDLQDVFRRFAFDNIYSVAFGVDPVTANNNSSNFSFLCDFDYAVEVSLERFMSPLAAVWKIKRFLNIGSEKKYKEAICSALKNPAEKCSPHPQRLLGNDLK